MSFLKKPNLFLFNEIGYCPNMSTVDFLPNTSHFMHINLDKNVKL